MTKAIKHKPKFGEKKIRLLMIDDMILYLEILRGAAEHVLELMSSIKQICTKST